MGVVSTVLRVVDDLAHEQRHVRIRKYMEKPKVSLTLTGEELSPPLTTELP